MKRTSSSVLQYASEPTDVAPESWATHSGSQYRAERLLLVARYGAASPLAMIIAVLDKLEPDVALRVARISMALAELRVNERRANSNSQKLDVLRQQ